MENFVPDPKMMEFWEKNIWPTISALCDARHPMSLVSARFQHNHKLIEKRYGQPMTVSICPFVLPNKVITDGFVPFGCSLSNGKPEVFVLIPSLMEVWNLLTHDFPQEVARTFDGSVAIGFLHETDHLATGLLGGQEFCATANHEQVVWAETCEHTMSPIVEMYGLRLNRSHQKFYNAWLKCNRNRDDEKWRSFVRSLYRRIK